MGLAQTPTLCLRTGRRVPRASYSTQEWGNLFDSSRSEAHCQIATRSPFTQRHAWRPPFTRMCVSVCSFQKPPARCCAVGTVNTLKVAACVTAAGRAPSATFPPTSALTSRAAATGPASWGPASATRATKGRTAKKVMPLRRIPHVLTFLSAFERKGELGAHQSTAAYLTVHLHDE